MITKYVFRLSRKVLFSIVIAGLMLSSIGKLQSVKGLGASPEPNLPAFHGAVGFDAQTQGGAGGQVLHSMNLNNSGAGSLRDEAAPSENLDGNNLSTTYYVSPSGSGTACTNSNPCSLSQVSLSPGATLYLKSGTYLLRTMLNFSASGTAASRITISTAPGEPAKAVISGDVNGNNAVDETDGPRANGALRWTPLVLLGGNYITFQNIEVKFSGGRCIQSNGSNNIISGNNSHHCWGEGIYIYGPNNLVESNTVYRAAESNLCGEVGGPRACKGNWSGGLVWGAADGTGDRGQNTIIRNNTVHHTSGEGILCIQASGGTVENNISYDNWALGMYLDQCSNMTIKGNYVYYTSDRNWWRRWASDTNPTPVRPADGIGMANEGNGGYLGMVHDIEILNNLVVGTGSGINFWRGWINGSRLYNANIQHNTVVTTQGEGSTGILIDSGSHSNVVIKNNIVSQSYGTVANAGSSVSFSYNLWHPLNGITGPGDIRQDPQFIDAFLGNYHLQPNSPACIGGEGGTYMGAFPCDGQPSPTVTHTPVPPTATKAAAPSPLPGLSWEAEQGEITAPFTTVNGVVSQSVLTDNPENGGRALYRFTVQDAGDYTVKAIVNAADAGSNSFFVGMDTEPDMSMIWDVTLTNGFEERTVSWREGASPDGNASTIKIFNLTTGEHMLIIRGREPGTLLEKIELVRVPIVLPTNTEVVTATPLPTQIPTLTDNSTATASPTATPNPDQEHNRIYLSPGDSLQDAINQANEGDTITIAGEHDLGGSVITVDRYLHFVGNNAVLRNGGRLELHTAATFENITFRDWRKNYQDAVFVPAGDVDGLVINNCVFEDIPSVILWRSYDYIFSNIAFTNNTVSNVNTSYHVYAIAITTGTISNISITGNTFENINANEGRNAFGIWLGDNSKDVSNVLVTNNTFDGLVAGLSNTARMVLAYGDNIQVLNNDISNINYTTSPRNCIYLKADNSVIDGNILHNCGNARNSGSGSLTLKRNFGHNVVSNNTLTSDYATDGLYIETNAYIFGNFINAPGRAINAYSNDANMPVIYQIDNNAVTSDIALQVWGHASGTGCGNTLNGEVRISASGFGFCTNSPTNIPEPTVTNAPMPTITPTEILIPPPQPDLSPLPGLSWEAEQGEIAPPFVAVNGIVSQSILTDNPANGGRALYRFTIPDAGEYNVKTIVNAADVGSNSFFVGMDAEPDTSMIWDIVLTNGFEERTVSWREGAGPDGNASTSKVFYLTPGEHTLIIRGREMSTLLDKVELVKVQVVQPTNPPVLTATSELTVTPMPTFTAQPMDTTPPVITNVSNLANTQLLITFSEDVGATGWDITNYRLNRASGDFVTIDSINYDGNSHITTLNINGGNALPPDNYIITVIGTTSIKDLVGNRLDGNADGTGGDDFVHSFSVQPPTQESPTASLTPVWPTSTTTPIPPSLTPTVTAVPPTPTVAPTHQASVETVYDDKDSAITYTGWWSGVRKFQAYKSSFRQTTELGATAALYITGESFSILYKSGPRYGTLDVYVDGVRVGSIDQKESPPVYQRCWDYPGRLSPGPHALKLVLVTPGATGSLDAVIVR